MTKLADLNPITKEQYNQIRKLELEQNFTYEFDGKEHHYHNTSTLFHKTSFTKDGRKIKFHCIVAHKPLSVKDYAKAITEQMGLEEGKDFFFEKVNNGYGGSWTSLTFKGGW